MQKITSHCFDGSAIRRFSSAFLCAGVLALAGCASTYVDTAIKEVPASSMKKPAQPQPVQLVFEFQSKGAPNARATTVLKEDVVKQVTNSGLFAKVANDPTPGIGLLSVTLNNVPLTDNPGAQGFVTGLTFGLAGSAVSDGYICTVTYLPAGQTKPLVKTARHAIHTTLGNANPPAGAIKAENQLAAVHTMTRDIVSNALKDLSDDPAFQ